MKLQIIPVGQFTLRLTGDLDIYNVESAREALLDQVADKPGLDLDLAAVETCDTAGIQLLLAAQRSAIAAGKTFSIQAPAPALEKCGQLLGLPPDLWPSHACKMS
jgi:anti-sigma B factor antagonist